MDSTRVVGMYMIFAVAALTGTSFVVVHMLVDQTPAGVTMLLGGVAFTCTSIGSLSAMNRKNIREIAVLRGSLVRLEKQVDRRHDYLIKTFSERLDQVVDDLRRDEPSHTVVIETVQESMQAAIQAIRREMQLQTLAEENPPSNVIELPRLLLLHFVDGRSLMNDDG